LALVIDYWFSGISGGKEAFCPMLDRPYTYLYNYINFEYSSTI
jgi:hypothetical protein